MRSARSVVAAIAPVMLDRRAAGERRQLLQEVVAGVEQAIAGLPPAVRKEVDAALRAARRSRRPAALVAGVWSPWPQASPTSIRAFLDHWRDSRLALLRSAYGALHQLVFGAWYGNSHAWPAIGYAGPPSLEVG